MWVMLSPQERENRRPSFGKSDTFLEGQRSAMARET